jgi:hypothetical protein
VAADATEPDRLTAEQAFEAMFRFLESCWREFKTVALSDVLGDVQPARDGVSADQAEWHRWIRCVAEVVGGSGPS